MTHDAPPSVHQQRTTAPLVTRLAQAGRSWKADQEDIAIDSPA
jgi:hypothetical protein